MIKFRSYPICIVYSKHRQERADDESYWYFVRGDKHMYEWMGTVGKELVAIEDDYESAYQGEVHAYERAVEQALTKICNTVVGRCLLNMLNPNEKIWIIPDPALHYKAMTGPATVKGRGGIRLRINPEDWTGDFDSTLVHELTHALRFSRNRYYNKPITNNDDYSASEEFLADQVANVYRSSLGLKQLYGTYLRAVDGTIYSNFIENAILVMAIKHCLDTEELARRIAQFPLLNPEFNPFKDYPILEREALNKMGFDGRYGAGKFTPL
jgi:hypothetical protein